ncbi:MAG: hypothetical protein MK096_01210 [Oleiphilaceae bacterium]|nr:hypothetical protein [Oleiphilaceae bacterium]
MSFSVLRSTHLIICLVAFLTLSACSETPPVASEEDEVQSINVFFSTENESGQDVGKAFQFNPESGRINELATFNAEPNSVVVLDTDEDAPGYEFAAYVDGKMIKLLNYSKTANRRSYDLKEFIDDVCGVFAAKRPAFSVFDSNSDYYLKTIDDTAVYVALKNGANCSFATNRYQYIDFDLSRVNIVNQSFGVSSSEVFGAFLFDPNFRYNDDSGDSQTGRSIWVSHNAETEALSGRVWDGRTLFDFPFEYKSENKPVIAEETPPPYIISASSNRLVIFRNQKDYDNSQVLQTSYTTLHEISVSTLNSLLNSDDIVASENAIQAYLSLARSTFDNLKQSSEPNHAINGSYIAYEADDSLYRYSFSSGSNEKVYDKEIGLKDFDFAILDSGDLIISKEFSFLHSLHIYPIDTQTSPIVAINNARDINLVTNKSRILINALAPSNILSEIVTSQSWTTAEINASRLVRKIENAKLGFLNNPIGTGDILIFVSDSDGADEYLINPYVAKYDGSQVDGIFNFEELDEDDEDRVISTTDAILGQIKGDVSSVSNKIYGANFSLNNDFGGFQVNTRLGTEGYFFEPKQTKDEEENRIQTLSLVKAVTTGNPITLNFATVTEQKNKTSINL